MAHTQGTSTNLVFGSPAVTGLIVQSTSLATKANVFVTVYDENGVATVRRYDDVTTEGSLEAVFQGITVPTPGTLFTVNSISYETVSTELKRENKGYQTLSIKYITSQGITPS